MGWRFLDSDDETYTNLKTQVNFDLYSLYRELCEASSEMTKRFEVVKLPGAKPKDVKLRKDSLRVNKLKASKRKTRPQCIHVRALSLKWRLPGEAIRTIFVDPEMFIDAVQSETKGL